jgi:two-component system NarL family sensor kinase
MSVERTPLDPADAPTRLLDAPRHLIYEAMSGLGRIMRRLLELVFPAHADVVAADEPDGHKTLPRWNAERTLQPQRKPRTSVFLQATNFRAGKLNVGMSEGVDIERRNHELSVLNAIARELNRSVNLGDAMDFTLSEVAELLELSTAWIWLMEGSEAYLAATKNLPPILAENPRLLDGSSYCYCLDTYKKGDLDGAANVNVVSCSRLKNLMDEAEGLRYHASIPLYSGDKKFGVMNVASPDWRSLSTEDLQLLYTIGDLLSIAVERARLFAESTRFGASEERNRLAREIHDTLAQTLSATTLQLESAEAMLDANKPEKARDSLSRALSLTRSNLDEARRSVLDLRAAPLEGRPLADALKSLIERWESEQKNTSARFLPVNAAHPLPPSVEAAIYRICQEALANITRHAEAERATIRLVLAPESARLTIEDDGNGCPEAAKKPGRHGLTGMRERAELLGGTFEFASVEGDGAKVEVEIPLESR